MSSPIPPSDEPTGDRCGGLRAQEVRPRGGATLRRGLSVSPPSREAWDAQDALQVRTPRQDRPACARGGATTEGAEGMAGDNTALERGLLPDLALRGEGFTTAFHYAPGRAHTLLGGDFCDVVRGEDGSVHVVMGDVSGHGAAEAALGVHLRLAWHTAVLCGQSQLEQLRLLERILTDERAREETYATVVSLVLPPHRRSLRMVSAGHPGFLHRHRGRVRWAEPRPALPLGLFPGQGDWRESELALSDGDGVVLFTDGLYEGPTSQGRLGEEGLLRLAARLAHLGTQAFVDALVHGASALAAPFGGLRDDVAVLHLACEGPGALAG